MNETDAIYIASFLDEKFRVYGTSQRPIFKASEIAKFMGYTKEQIQFAVSKLEDSCKIKITFYYDHSSCRNWFVTEYGVYKLAIEKNNYISNKFAKRVREIVHDIKEMNIEKEIEHSTIQMDALKFLQEKTRMMLSDVKSYNELKNIPTNDGIVKFVCEWSKKHPVKTREEDFWKKHPNAKVDCDFYTEFCCETLGYCKKCNHNYDASFCKSCWNEQV